MTRTRPAPPPPAEAAEYIETAAASAILHLQPQTLNAWRCTGRHRLKFYKAGHRVLYKKSEVLDYLNGRSATITGQLAAANS
jgi:hypothetical protein